MSASRIGSAFGAFWKGNPTPTPTSEPTPTPTPTPAPKPTAADLDPFDPDLKKKLAGDTPPAPAPAPPAPATAPQNKDVMAQFREHVAQQEFGLEIKKEVFDNFLQTGDPKDLQAAFNSALREVYSRSILDVQKMVDSVSKTAADTARKQASILQMTDKAETVLADRLPGIANKPAYKPVVQAAMAKYLEAGLSQEEAADATVGYLKRLTKDLAGAGVVDAPSATPDPGRSRRQNSAEFDWHEFATEPQR